MGGDGGGQACRSQERFQLDDDPPQVDDASLAAAAGTLAATLWPRKPLAER